MDLLSRLLGLYILLDIVKGVAHMFFKLLFIRVKNRIPAYVHHPFRRD